MQVHDEDSIQTLALFYAMDSNLLRYLSFSAFAACTVLALISKKISRLPIRRTQLSSTQKKSYSYQESLLELELPREGEKKIPQLLENDLAISRAVANTAAILRVFISSSEIDSESDVLSYISDTYARLWDEIVQKENFSLSCIVLGKCCQLSSEKDILQSKTLKGIFSSNATNIHQISDFRNKLNLPSITFENTSCTLFDLSYYYLDDLGRSFPKFKKVALGGTFDRLHNGHKKLLTLAAAVCTDVLVVGVMSDELLRQKKGAELIIPFFNRLQQVEEFLRQIKPSLTLELPKLIDPFGPTITDTAIEAIVVSSETVPGAKKINELRLERGMPPLAILITRRADAASLSSSFLREKHSTHDVGKIIVLKGCSCIFSTNVSVQVADLFC
eukprot:gene9190-19052_t